MAQRRRSLSNIIGAVILIAATIVGGLLVYNYFQKSLGTFMSMGNSVLVTPSETPLSNNETAIYFKVTNDEPSPITIVGIYLVGPNGSVAVIDNSSTNSGGGVLVSSEGQVDIGSTLNPGQTATGVFIVRGYYSEVYIEYQMGGATYYTQPVSLS